MNLMPMIMTRVKMQINKTSSLTGVNRTKILKIDPVDMRAWREGKLTQDAFPYLNKHEREFLISGITEEEWDKHFPKEEE
jgi:hypothetical protein